MAGVMCEKRAEKEDDGTEDLERMTSLVSLPRGEGGNEADDPQRAPTACYHGS